MLKIIQEEAKKVKTSDQKQSSVFCSTLCSISIILTFAILFLLFQDDSERYKDCDNNQLRKWSLGTSINLFISAALALTIKIAKILTPKANKLYFFGVFCIFIVGLVFAIGLHVNNSEECGSLYKLSLSYYILVYLSIGLSVFSLIFYIPRVKLALSSISKQFAEMYDNLKTQNTNNQVAWQNRQA